MAHTYMRNIDLHHSYVWCRGSTANLPQQTAKSTLAEHTFVVPQASAQFAWRFELHADKAWHQGAVEKVASHDMAHVITL
eukprot:4873499-Amphidinium_carterae.1